MSDAIWPRGVSAPAARALAAAGYRNLEQLAGVRERDLLALHGMGPKAIRVLLEALVAQGLDFGEPAADQST
ncbi:DNA-binding protein [Nocardia sp. CA-151230]|uniref:DNA-binding protein n=1 Tax=Nocardia sp. CA-151230 TaxID=3239982 RepID=UPI003D8C9A69